jgi:hypothetical protein
VVEDPFRDGWPQRGTGDLAAQEGDLVTQYEQFDVLGPVAM